MSQQALAHVFAPDANGMTAFLLPTRTVGDTLFECTDPARAKDGGLWAMRLMATKGVSRLMIGTHNGQDCVWLKIVDPYKRPAIERILGEFLSNIGPDGKPKNPKLALLSHMGTLTPEAFRARANQYLAQHKNEPYIAGAKALVSLFNDCMAGPDGGEVLYKGYKVENGQGVVEVELKDRCSTCSAKDISMQVQLMGLFRTHMPALVSKVRIV
ncbi:MAG: hypothetical protein KGQ41_01510 [Alphaproteobacteria bacterium]|nr:hypothetical protein [Alphaproteobacteria bacterium]